MVAARGGSQPKPTGSPIRTAIGVLVVALSAPGVLLWLWSRPIPARPDEMPPLLLSPAQVSAQLERDNALAREIPDTQATRARAHVYAASNVAEFVGQEQPGESALRRQRLTDAFRAVIDTHGEQAVAHIRAADVARFEAALHAPDDETQTREAVGGFMRMMERYGMARAGRQSAPRFVVRTTFKARWNAMHGLALTDGFSEVERRAYWGWLALNARDAPFEHRLEALGKYAEAGGERVEEARAILLFEAGRAEEAADAFLAAGAAHPSFRLRNYALFALEEEAGEPAVP